MQHDRRRVGDAEDGLRELLHDQDGQAPLRQLGDATVQLLDCETGPPPDSMEGVLARLNRDALTSQDLASSAHIRAIAESRSQVLALLEQERQEERLEQQVSELVDRGASAELLGAATNHAAIGWPEAGRIEPGAPADLVAVSLDSVRLAGAEPDTLLESAVFAATAADVDALAQGDTVATLLPGAEFSTRAHYPDARRLLDAGVTVALAADCNPGTSYTTSIPFCIALAVREMGMTPGEAVWAATAGGGQAPTDPDDLA